MTLIRCNHRRTITFLSSPLLLLLCARDTHCIRSLLTTTINSTSSSRMSYSSRRLGHDLIVSRICGVTPATCQPRPWALTRLLLFGFGEGDEKRKMKNLVNGSHFSPTTREHDSNDSVNAMTSEASLRQQQQRPQGGASSLSATATTMENFKKVQQVGKRTAQLSDELAGTTVSGQDRRGKVKVFVDGQQRPKGIEIDDSYLESVTPVDLVTDITAAMQDAHAKSAELMAKKMQFIYTDLGIPQSNAGK